MISSLRLLAIALLGTCMATVVPAEEDEPQRTLHFSDQEPLVDREGRILQPVPERIDISRQEAGPINPLAVKDWTIAVWNFPAWTPGGKHWPELASRAPLRMPLLYDSSNPDAHYNGIMYYSLADRRAMDWQVKWMAEHGVNLVMFDWYPSGSQETFDRGTQQPHRHINASIEQGFLGKEQVGGPAVPTNPYAQAIDFAIMWTNHGNAWIPEGTMEYACEQYLSQPNYYRMDGERPLVIIHSAHALREEHGAEGPEGLEKLQAYLQKQRDIASSYGHDIYLALGQLAHQHSPHFKRMGFDGVINYVTIPAAEELTTIRLVREETRNGATSEGTLRVGEFTQQVWPAQLAEWKRMVEQWGRDFFPTLTMREDWRHWHVNDRMFYLYGGTPARYEIAVREAMKFVQENELRQFLCVGIWNEIYEGAYLEPDLQYGYEYLKALRRALLAEEHSPDQAHQAR